MKFSKSHQRPPSKRFRESTHLIPTPGVELVRPRKFVSYATFFNIFVAYLLAENMGNEHLGRALSQRFHAHSRYRHRGRACGLEAEQR